MRQSFSRRQLFQDTTALAAASVAAVTWRRPLLAQDRTTRARGQTSSRSSRGRGSSDDDYESRVSFVDEQTQRWRVGLKLQARSSLQNVLATFPIPVDWPEQSVRLVNKSLSSAVTGWKTRVAPGGTTQVVLVMPRVAASTQADALFEFDVKKSRIVGPTEVDDLVIPKKVSRELSQYLGTSPEIDTTHRFIRDAYKEVAAEQHDNAWELVRSLYIYVREKVRYVNGSIAKASQALRSGQGDCEEMTSLVIALCRNAKIPARMVWIPNHCYPEFYLEDARGNGHWFPCQAAGSEQFGSMEEYKPILQKGDRFKVPEKKGKQQRYLTEFFTCEVKGKQDPRPEFILDRVEV
ncbi:MAG: transglutaminase domain-containing protein [Planctomycetota bacterium]